LRRDQYLTDFTEWNDKSYFPHFSRSISRNIVAPSGG
jgi:hypothetical protein